MGGIVMLLKNNEQRLPRTDPLLHSMGSHLKSTELFLLPTVHHVMRHYPHARRRAPPTAALRSLRQSRRRLLRQPTKGCQKAPAPATMEVERVAGHQQSKVQSLMDVRVSTRDVQQFDGDAVAVGVFSDDEGLQGPAAVLDDAMAGVLGGLRAAGEITGVADECVILHTLGKIEPLRVAVVGFGKREKFTTDRLRRSAAIACRKLRPAGARRVGQIGRAS